MAKAALATQRVPLTSERIVDAAIAFVDAHGLSALTMRSLAAALDVQPMSLYHHVANKDAILAGIIDSLLTSTAVADGALDWRAWVSSVFRSLRAVTAEHPGAIEVFYSVPATGSTARSISGTGFELFLTAGFSAVHALHAVHSVSMTALGLALDEREPPEGKDTAALRSSEEQMRAAHPAFAALTEEEVLAVDQWHFTETIVVAGLEALLSTALAPSATTTKKRK